MHEKVTEYLKFVWENWWAHYILWGSSFLLMRALEK